MAARLVHDPSGPEGLKALLGDEVEDAAEGAFCLSNWKLSSNLFFSPETFLLFAQEIPSQNLGFVDSSAVNLDVDVGKRTYTIRQSPGLLQSDRAAGTTGAVLWKVTPLVASWLSSTDNFLWELGWLRSDCTVIELGCGVSGLVALSMAPLLSSGSYVLTDQAYVMKLLRQNLSLNQPGHGHGKLPRQRLQVQTLTLDWETDAASNIAALLGMERKVDLIVACDCIYNEYLIRPLVSTCALLCALRADEPMKTGLLIAQQLRSEVVLQTWLEEMLKSFVVFRVPADLLPEELRKGYVVHVAILR